MQWLVVVYEVLGAPLAKDAWVTAMTPSEKRSAAELLEEAAIAIRMTHQKHVVLPHNALASALRAEAEAMEKAAGEITPEMDGALLAQMMQDSTQYADAREGLGAPDWGAAYSAKLAALASAHGALREREECLRALPAHIPMPDRSKCPVDPHTIGYNTALDDCDVAIRARKP